MRKLNLRTNHSKQSAGGGTMIRFGLFFLILGALFYAFQLFFSEREKAAIMSTSEIVGPLVQEDYFPSSEGKLVKNTYYALSYSEPHGQAEWVAYELTRERLHMKWVKRTNNFRPDSRISSHSAEPEDYRRSGYDRGHLVPAADMAFSRQAMSETFLMSNISPQTGGFNKGIWRELEELTRDWANKFKHLYVVSGPVLKGEVLDEIGDNKVAVPSAYYKVLLDLTHPEQKGIGFVFPNEVCDEPISNYAVSIDRVEEVTGIDFFPDLLGEKEEKALEADFDPDLWPLNQKKYEIRVRHWNKQ